MQRFAMLFLAVVAASTLQANEDWPEREWVRAEPAEVATNKDLLAKARDYAKTGGGSGLITRHGKLVMSWGDLDKTYDLKSTSKSIGVTALGLAIADGKIKLEDKARKHHPKLGKPPDSNDANGWVDEITILHLVTQTAGFAKPGGYQKLLFRPGTKWHYSDGGPNWLAECVTLVYKRDIEELMFERVLTPIGVTHKDLRWRNNAYRDHKINGMMRREFGSGVHANVDAMARIGYLYLRKGNWKGAQLIPSNFVKRARTTVDGVVGVPEHEDRYGNASDHYGLLWWNNADGAIGQVPRDTYWSWGLYDSLIVVIPSLDIVASRAGKSWKRDQGWGHYEVLEPFLQPIAAAVKSESNEEDADPKAVEATPTLPYPRSTVITGIEWASPESIVRKAKGSDNWPLTWADDDHLYTAYGDGWGFEPRVEKKLSMGFAKIIGGPDNFRGVNVRSPSGEARGQGAAGRKVSGMLMVDGMLYAWVRNAKNSQLGWSTDYGNSWTWSDWKFTTSFGYPTFLNFGKNYAGARDEFVYVYSNGSDSAYKAADRMVLARVPKDRIRDRKAYEFFVEPTSEGKAHWTREIEQRGSVFVHPRKCYRSGITYNAPLNRYLWCQVLPASKNSGGPRFEGGFGIYDAPEPWGPWTTAFYAEHWDVGPGETNSLPTKWMSEDGKTVHLVSSGDDCFSVRKGALKVTR